MAVRRKSNGSRVYADKCACPLFLPKGGTIHGATDEFGYKAVEGVQNIHDLHATMLHLLGMDHKKLTFRFGGRDMRLTDVHGELIEEILA